MPAPLDAPAGARPHPRPRPRTAQRVIDVLGAVIALVLLGLPMIAVALWVKLDSPGPVFFRQERVGRGGRPFRIHKFRTMRIDAERAGPQITVGADPRITRAGAVLRAHRLDELAQFIDVLAGTMSLVGPRPEVPRYVAVWPPALRDRVLAVKPGITDPASLEFRGESELLAAAADPEREYVEVILPAKLAVSAAYAERATFRTDLAVICRTIAVLLKR